MNHKNKFRLKDFLLNLDQYISAILFIFIMILLTIQVVSRYFFHHSVTWTEELAVILFVWMTYFGVSSAVTYRKHLKIDALLNALPFKIKRVLLIIDDIIFIIFNCYLWDPYLKILGSLGNSTTSLLHIPKWISYILIPIMLTFASAKLILDIWKLAHETEKNLGAAKPSIDLDACEKAYQDKKVKEGSI